MDCQEVKANLSGYLDQVLHQKEEEKVIKHLKTCSSCQEELAALKMVLNELQNSAEISPPSGFSGNIRERLEKELIKSNKKVIGKIFKKSWAVAAVVVLLILASPLLLKQQSADIALNKEISTGQSESQGGVQAWNFADGESQLADNSGQIAGPKPSYGGERGARQQEVPDSPIAKEEVALDETSTVKDSDQTVTRKVITQGYIQLKVKSLKEVSEKITLVAETAGGFIESSSYNENNQGYASLVLRIPAKDYQKIFDQVQKMGKLEAKETNGQDVTMKSVDLEARLKTLETQEERLLALLEKGKDLEEILKIETELQRVRQEIETVTAELKTLNDLVDLATLRVELYQTNVEPVSASSLETPGFKGVFKGAYNALIDSLNQMIKLLGQTIVFLGGALPYLVVLGLMYGIYYWARGRYFNKGR